jgi:hypothetical protein
MTYHIFHRTWWKRNPRWPDGREPGAGKKHTIAHVETEVEAREMCRQWNEEKPDHSGLSDKAEYEEV